MMIYYSAFIEMYITVINILYFKAFTILNPDDDRFNLYNPQFYLKIPKK